LKLRAAIFDLDGTLLDTLGDLALAYNAALGRLGFPTHPTDAYRNFVGSGIEASVRRSLPEGRADEETVSEVVKVVREEYAERWPLGTRPFGGIPDVLDDLVRRCVPMSILSNKPDDTARLMVGQLLPEWPFVVVSGARPGCPEKPDPVAALEIAGKMGARPDECAFIGDSGVDMQTARNSGMFGIGVLWGFRDERELRDSGAAAVAAKPSELLQFLSSDEAPG
jgi:phosphoglycolate phosphatase